MDQNQITDLDAIAPVTRKVKFGGQEYIVQPPRLKMMPAFARQLQKIATLASEEDQEKVVQVLEEFNVLIRQVIPQLPEDADFTLLQANALIEMIMEMVMPPEAKKLKEEGLTPAQKKTGTVS